MPTYYFHIRMGDEFVRDQEGIEMHSMRDALTEAQQAARDILSDSLRQGEKLPSALFEVHDDVGIRLFTLPFSSVMRLE